MTDTAKAWVAIFVCAIFGWSIYLYSDNKVACETLQEPKYSSSTQQSADMYDTEKKVTQEGVNGETEHCYSKAKDISRTVTKYPVDEIVMVGTKNKAQELRAYREQQAQEQAVAAPASCPITTCNDGSCSSSTGRGTCSWHGGVASYNY